jgi:hypothetical protein
MMASSNEHDRHFHTRSSSPHSRIFFPLSMQHIPRLLMRVLRHAAHCMLHAALSREVHVTCRVCILTPYLSALSSHANARLTLHKSKPTRQNGYQAAVAHLSKIFELLLDSCRVWHGSLGWSLERVEVRPSDRNRKDGCRGRSLCCWIHLGSVVVMRPQRCSLFLLLA